MPRPCYNELHDSDCSGDAFDCRVCLDCGCPCPGETCAHCYEDWDTVKVGCPTPTPHQTEV